MLEGVILFCVVLVLMRDVAKFGRETLDFFYSKRPTVQERNDNLNWIADYIQRHPNESADLIKQYPQCAKRAFAALQYEHINGLLERGVISESRYEELLEEILPQISIEADIMN
jgi:phenolic acid decarboxylase